MTKAVFSEGLLFLWRLVAFKSGLRTELLKIYLSRKILITLAGNNSRKKYILVNRNKS